jgi:hypothetical protein
VLCLRLSQRGKEVARLQRHAPKQQRSDGLRCACEHLSATCTQRPQRTSVHAGVLTPGATLCWGARPCQVPTVNTPLHRKIETSKQSARNAGRMIEQSHTAASHLRIFQRSTFLYLRKGASEQHKLHTSTSIVQGDNFVDLLTRVPVGIPTDVAHPCAGHSRQSLENELDRPEAASSQHNDNSSTTHYTEDYGHGCAQRSRAACFAGLFMTSGSGSIQSIPSSEIARALIGKQTKLRKSACILLL